jgi:hypothetical protein
LLAACYSIETYTISGNTTKNITIRQLLIGSGTQSWALTPTILGMKKELSPTDVVTSTVSTRFTAVTNIASLVKFIPTAGKLLICSLKTLAKQFMPLGQCTTSDFCLVN